MPNPALSRFNSDSPAGQSIDFGTQDITVPSTTGNVVYILEELNHAFFDSDWQVTRNALGIPNKQAAVQKVPEIQCTLQCTGNAGLPNGFAQVDILAKNGITYSWWVKTIGLVTKNDGTPSALTLSLQYKLN
jgi:hypothetical protein